MLQRLGDYRVTAVLRAGADSLALEAESIFGQKVLVQAVPLTPSAEEYGVRQRFRRDTQRLIELEHRGLAKMIDAGETDEWMYVVLEAIEGPHLSAIEPLDVPGVVSVAVELGDTLSQLHDLGVVVGNLQPSHVMIDDTGRVVLTGLAMSVLSAARSGRLDVTSIGRPGFVAPEVIRGADADAASDQYSFGRLLVYLATGDELVPASEDEPVEEQLRRGLEIDWLRFPMSDAASELRRFVTRMVHDDPRERYPSLSQCLADLIRLAQDLPAARNIERADKTDAEGASIMRAPLETGHEFVFEISRVSSSPSMPVALPGSPLTMPVGLGSDKEPAIPWHTHLVRGLDLGEDDIGEETEPPKDDPTEPTRLPGMERARTPPPESDAIRDALLARTAIPRRVTDPPEEQITEAAPIQVPETREPTPPPVERRQTAQPTSPIVRSPTTDRRLLLAVFVMTALAGLSGGFLAGKPPRAAYDVVYRVEADDHAPLVVAYDGDPPRPTAIDDARELLARARGHIAAQQLKEAETMLVQCIRRADLPDCHRTLASLLSLSQRRGVRAHVQHYLAIRPGAADAEGLRRLLTE